MTHESVSYIVSLKYAEGLSKLFRALGENLERSGRRVKYLLSHSYEWMMDPRKHDAHYLTVSSNVRTMVIDTARFLLEQGKPLQRLFQRFPPEFMCFYNPHPLNFIVAKQARRSYPPGIRVMYLHEPYKPDKSPFSPTGAIYFSLAEHFQTLCLRETNHVIVPSDVALAMFQERYRDYPGDVHVAPILVPDTHVAPFSNHEREFFTLVGKINRAKGLDTFLELVEYAAVNGERVQFQIISPSSICKDLQALTDEGRALLKIVNHERISDEEIIQAISKSIAVLLLHKQVTQSGVLPLAFMCGTPVIARGLPGFAQHVQHGYTGYLLAVDASPKDLLAAVRFVKHNFTQLSRHARACYEERFADANWCRYYGWLGAALDRQNVGKPCSGRVGDTR